MRILFKTLFLVGAYVGGLVMTAWALHDILNGTDNIKSRIVAVIAGIMTPWLIAHSRFQPPVRITMADAMAGSGSLIIAGIYLLTWARPSVMGNDSVEIMVLMLILEFILIHSAPFLALTLEAPGSLTKRVLTTLGVSAIYAIVTFAVAASFHNWVPVVIFGSAVLNKFFTFFFHRVKVEDPTAREKRWAFSGICYLGCVFISVFVPVPKLGAYSLHGNGIWMSSPEQALAAAAVYFSLLGFYELYFQCHK
jgi:hypothetical protein